MIENIAELVSPSMTSLCLAGNKLSENAGKKFAMAINHLALAKNIRLEKGVLQIWEECLVEDLRNKEFTFDEFLIATKSVIRGQTYGRLDYADIFCAAKKIIEEEEKNERARRNLETRRLAGIE